MNDYEGIVYRVQCDVTRPHLPHRYYHNTQYEECYCAGLWTPWGSA